MYKASMLADKASPLANEPHDFDSWATVENPWGCVEKTLPSGEFLGCLYCTVLRSSVRTLKDFPRANPRLQNLGGCPLAQCDHPQHYPLRGQFFHTAPRISISRFQTVVQIISIVVRHASTLNSPSIPLRSSRYGEPDGSVTDYVLWIYRRRTRRPLHPPTGGLCNTATKSIMFPDSPPWHLSYIQLVPRMLPFFMANQPDMVKERFSDPEYNIEMEDVFR